MDEAEFERKPRWAVIDMAGTWRIKNLQEMITLQAMEKSQQKYGPDNPHNLIHNTSLP